MYIFYYPFCENKSHKKMKKILLIYLAVVVFILHGCTSSNTEEPPTTYPKLMEESTYCIGKLSLDHLDKKLVGKMNAKHTYLIPIKRLEKEIPSLSGTEEEIAQQKKANDTTFTVEEMEIGGRLLEDLTNTNEQLLDHVYIKYSLTKTGEQGESHDPVYERVLHDLILDDRDTVKIGRIE